MKELMIYVERIVRPVRSRERRKLAMRRELLLHLQSALAEERASVTDEAAALQAAKRRLGEPAELTRSLQASVPWLERTLLGYVPAPRWANAWERKMGEQMGMRGMTLGQMSILTLGTAVLSYATVLALAMVYLAKHRDAAMRALAEHTWVYPAGHIVANCLLVVFLGVCFKRVGETARNRDTTRSSAVHAGIISGLLMGWMAVIVSMVAGQRVSAPELVYCVAAGVAVAWGLGLLGRLIARMGRGYAEWLSLEIEQ